MNSFIADVILREGKGDLEQRYSFVIFEEHRVCWWLHFPLQPLRVPASEGRRGGQEPGIHGRIYGPSQEGGKSLQHSALECCRGGKFWDNAFHQVAKFHDEEKELFNSLNSAWSSSLLWSLRVTKALLTSHPHRKQSLYLTSSCI